MPVPVPSEDIFDELNGRVQIRENMCYERARKEDRGCWGKLVAEIVRI